MSIEPVTLKRAIQATSIPDGSMAHLSEGTQMFVTQALGDSVTVRLVTMPGLFRIDGADADALGLERPSAHILPDTNQPLVEQVWACLRTCYDPEIPVNIVDLGLIYSVTVDEGGEQGITVSVTMTLTAPGCGMGPAIAADAQRKIEALEGVTSAKVEVVWDPPWGPERISEAGRKALGITPS